MKIITIMLGCAAVAALLAVAMARTSSPPDPSRFDEAWQDTMQVAVLKKTDRLATIIDPPQVPVGKIEPDAPVVTTPIVIVEKNQPEVKRKPRETNVCTRHNKHKVWISKYKWRCRK